MTQTTSKQKQIKIELFMKVESVANKSEHWRSKHKRNKEQKLYIKSALSWEKQITTPVAIKITRIAPRKLDYDNLVAACKHVVDAISEWIYPDMAAGRADGMPGMEWIYDQRKGKPGEYALEIEMNN